RSGPGTASKRPRSFWVTRRWKPRKSTPNATWGRRRRSWRRSARIKHRERSTAKARPGECINMPTMSDSLQLLDDLYTLLEQTAETLRLVLQRYSRNGEDRWRERLDAWLRCW